MIDITIKNRFNKLVRHFCFNFQNSKKLTKVFLMKLKNSNCKLTSFVCYLTLIQKLRIDGTQKDSSLMRSLNCQDKSGTSNYINDIRKQIE